MIRLLLKRFVRRTPGKDLADHIAELRMGGDDKRGVVLAHAALVLGQLWKRQPEVDRVWNGDPGEFEEEASLLVQELSALSNEYRSAGKKENAAGAVLLTHSFQCCTDRQLARDGQEIWTGFGGVIAEALRYLQNLRLYHLRAGNNRFIERIDDAIGYVGRPPRRLR